MINANYWYKIVNAYLFFKVVQLNRWCLYPPLCSLMRSWITDTIGGHNWIFGGLTNCNASCWLIVFIWDYSRNQWYPLASGSSHSLSPQKVQISSAKDPLSFSLLPFIWGSLLMLLFCRLLMMVSQSSLPFACSMILSLSSSHICGRVRLASDSELTSDFDCNVVLPNSRFEVAIHSTFAICCGAWPSGLGALALTGRDNYSSSRS